MRNTPLVLIIAAGTLGCSRHRSPADDVVPAVLSAEPAIPYPPELFARRVEGEVLLYLVVDSAGTAVTDSTRVAHSSGQAAFDAAALDAAAALRFTPAHLGARPVMAPIQVPIRFTLPDSIKHPKAPK